MSEALNSSNNPAAASSNMDVLLQAVSMAAPSPRRSANSADTIMSRSAVEQPSISAPLLPPAGSLWQTASHFMAPPPPLVTPPTTVELLEHTGNNNLPILTHHRAAPSAIKSDHYGLFTTSSSLPAPKIRTNHHPSMFVTTNSLPFKKRFARPPPNGTLCDDGSIRIQSIDRCDDGATTTMTQTSAPNPPTTGSNNTATATKKEKKKYRKPQCSHPTCTNRVMNQGVCARHGARVRICSITECSKYAQKGGVCIKHGAKKEYKRCCVAGCNSRATAGGTLNGRSVCSRHASTCCVEIPIEARQDVSAGGRRIAQEEQRETF